MKTRKWRYAVVIAVVVVAALVAITAAVRIMRERTRKSICVSCLRNIVYGCYIYVDDFDGCFPDNPGRLYPCLLSDSRLFICPNAESAVRFVDAELPPGAKDAGSVFGPHHTSYAYVAGLTDKAKSSCVLFFDKTPHPGGVRNVAFVGGNVMTYSEAQFKRELERTLREARAAGFDAKIWGYAPGEELPVTLDE